MQKLNFFQQQLSVLYLSFITDVKYGPKHLFQNTLSPDYWVYYCVTFNRQAHMHSTGLKRLYFLSTNSARLTTTLLPVLVWLQSTWPHLESKCHCNCFQAFVKRRSCSLGS